MTSRQGRFQKETKGRGRGSASVSFPTLPAGRVHPAGSIGLPPFGMSEPDELEAQWSDGEVPQAGEPHEACGTDEQSDAAGLAAVRERFGGLKDAHGGEDDEGVDTHHADHGNGVEPGEADDPRQGRDERHVEGSNFGNEIEVSEVQSVVHRAEDLPDRVFDDA